ncbi:MAG: hypothetical protein AB7F88_18340 [Pyrinomonadaceae bacterium]
MYIQNIRVAGIFIVTAIVLLIPYAAMRFTNEVNWKPLDFVAAGVLLVGAGLTCELALRLIKKRGFRIAACAIVLLALLVVWAELAVGIFGTPFAGS